LKSQSRAAQPRTRVHSTFINPRSRGRAKNGENDYDSRGMADVRLLCLDVDGVLTDGRIFTAEDGRQMRAFHVQDGLAIRWFQRLGGVVAICSGKSSPAVTARARELRIDHVLQGSENKLATVSPLLAQLALGWSHVAVIGDDLPDLAILRTCGFPIAVQNAVAEVKQAARYVTQRPGGYGAVREAIELLLQRSGRWREIVQHYERQRPDEALETSG
jgi:3-deoxy-D-manno-octulosonate 8-phosphate phosphatase (KDO 8-P phosphatase)